MKSIKFIFLLSILFILPVISHAQEFSADTVSVMNGKQITGKVYCMPDRWRIEAETEGKHQISIIRKDKKLVWHIAEQQKQYIEFPLREEDLKTLFAVQKVNGEMKREAVGKEVINGRKTTKYKVYFEIKKMQGVMYQWTDDEYKIPMKTTDTEGKFVSELENIKMGPQRGDLFELPAGYTKYAIPMSK